MAAFARDVYTATASQTDFTITFSYEDEDHVLVYQNGSLLTKTTNYTFFNATTIRLTVGATLNDTIVIQRSTSQDTRLTNFTAGTLTSNDLNDDSRQLFYMAQESIDIANTALGLDANDEWDATSKPINNVSDPTDAQDAATKNYVDGVALGSFPSPLAVGSGGTGSTTAAAARTALGLVIDTDVQSHVMTTQGDMVRGGASGAPERFATGASGTVLVTDGTDPQWEDPDNPSLANYAIPSEYIAGLTLSNNGTDAAHDIDIAVGSARDGSDSANLKLTSALTKQIDASWAVGTDAGGLDGTESVAGTPDANTWYHVWLIRRSDTGVVDALFSESATAPTMPTNYDQKRRIGAVLTDGSANIIAFTQLGNHFIWTAPVNDHSQTNPGTSAVTPTVNTPLGINAWWHGSFSYRTTASGGLKFQLVSSPLQTDTAPSSTQHTSGYGINNQDQGMSTHGPGVMTNTSSQIRFRVDESTAAFTAHVETMGWEDPRGRW